MSDLSALLEREASAEIEAILTEARERASAVVAEARSEAEQLLATRRRAAEAQREAALVRARSAAQLEASALRLQAQHAALEGVFTAARERMGALAGDAKAYRAVLGRLLQEAVDDVGATEVARVTAATSDLATVRTLVKAAGLEVPVEASDDVALGVRVVSRRHSTVENTLDARLAALAGELAADVSRTLFAADPADGATEGG